MKTDLIKVTEFGANVERPWEQVNIKSGASTLSVTRACSCSCIDKCTQNSNVAAVAFPEP